VIDGEGFLKTIRRHFSFCEHSGRIVDQDIDPRETSVKRSARRWISACDDKSARNKIGALPAAHFATSVRMKFDRVRSRPTITTSAPRSAI
jgi:hypothetical protein